MEESTDEQQNIREKRIAQLAPFQYKKGQTGNALGRYMGGISGKERLKRMIAGMNDEEFEEWCEGINKIDLFKMAEGNPANATDITTKGRPIIELAKEIIEKNEITTHDSNTSSSNNSEGQAPV